MPSERYRRALNPGHRTNPMKAMLNQSHRARSRKDTAGLSAGTFSNTGNGCNGEVRGCASPSLVLSKVVEIVAAEAGLTPAELLDRTRIQRTAWPRNVAYWCAFQLLSKGAAQMVLGRKLAPMSQVEIAKFFGRDRSAVVYGAATVDAMVTTRPEVRMAVEGVLVKIRATL